jgi:uncharacterized delta-60 repeat protein
MKNHFLFLGLILTTICSFAQTPGSLDGTFNTTGYVVTPITSGDDWGRSVVIQPNGKIVVGGRSYDTQWKFSMARYLINGALDPSFGTGGKVVTAMGMEGGAYSIARQSNGKLVMAGYYNNGSNYDFALARFDTTGALDLTFNSTGKVSTAIGSASDVAHAVAIQTDQKIVVVGYSNNGTNYDIALTRYNTNGALDATFGSGGKVVTPVGSYDDDVYGLVIQPNGKIVVAGYSFNGTTNQGVLARYLPGGTLDNTFGTNGIVLLPNGGQWDNFFSLARQSDGKLVCGGYHSPATTNRNFTILRFDTTGVLDPTFSGNGVVQTDFYGNDDEAYGVVVQPNGQIVAAGYAINGTAKNFALTRYNANGTVDNTFGSSGIVTTPLGNPNAYGISLALQTDGKIVVAGRADGTTNVDFAVARYNGSLITSVNDSPDQNDVMLFPNPATDKLFIDYPNLYAPKEVSIKICNIQGSILMSQTLLKNTPEINVAHLPKGLYFISITLDRKTIIKKFVKE